MIFRIITATRLLEKLLYLLIMDELKTIFAEIPKLDKKKFESIIKVFTLTFSDVKIEELEFNEIGPNYLVSLKISPKYYATLIEKLTLNKIKVLTNDPEAEKVINHAKGRLKKRETKGFDGWDGLARIGEPKRNDDPIEKIVEDGDYVEIIRIINDLDGDKNRREEAKKQLGTAVNIAIQKYYNEALVNPRLINTNIDKILEIASDGFLKARNHTRLMERAAQVAMDLALSDPKYYEKLIMIGNDIYLPPKISLKAIVAFTKATFADKQTFRDQIRFALKYANLKQLVRAYEQAKGELSADERKIIKTFATFINQQRTHV